MVAKHEPEEGEGIDRSGGPVVDPTKNVLDLVKAESIRVNELREASDLLLNELRTAEAKRQDGLRDAETRRQDDLRAQRTEYEARIENLKTDYQKQIAAILSAQTDKSAILLSTTVDKLTTATTERLAAVEKNQYVTGGKTSVTDPATADALTRMADALKGLTTRDDKSEARGAGQGQVIAWIVAGIASAGVILDIVLRFSQHG